MPAQGRSSANQGTRGWVRLLLWFLLSAGIATTSLIAFQDVEALLISDSRFVLAPPPEYSAESPNLRITGVRNASRRAVTEIFASDFGRSIYLTPIAERRRNLLAVDWVRDATVSRVWPNRIDLHIEERQPVAFVALPGSGSAARLTLIDRDGVLLQPQGPLKLKMPVIIGIRRDQSETARRDRVHRMERLLEESGPHASQISDIDVSRPENLTVTFKLDGRAFVLTLGDRDFRERLDNFVQHYPEIRKHAPGATLFDLRVGNRIILPSESEPAGAFPSSRGRKE